MDDIKIGLLNNYAALEAEPEKCPTCGSEDKNVRNWQCLPPGMRDFWHFLITTDSVNLNKLSYPPE
jgi:hypothetical protein